MNFFKLDFGNDVMSVVFDWFDKNQILDFSDLSESETQIYSGFLSDKRKREYFFGRRACKKAVSLLEPGVSDKYQEISILNAKSGCPYIVGSSLIPSISHTNGAVVAVVGTKIFGIDIEKYDVRRIKALKRISSESEDPKRLLVLWTLKESLGKALKTGIIKDFTHYETENFQNFERYFRSDFKNFSEYESLAVLSEQMATAIVFKKEYHLSNENIETLAEFMKDSITCKKRQTEVS